MIGALKQLCCSLTTRRRKLAAGTYAAVDKVTRIGSAQSQGVGNCYGDAVIDEVRISNTARSVDWITTEYNTHSRYSRWMPIRLRPLMEGNKKEI
ncbi:MAG: hypothetical protein IT165_27165 [Bryobacterales bacterium]|nr:hypothetical protein [Bryobacterales bacterium]